MKFANKTVLLFCELTKIFVSELEKIKLKFKKNNIYLI